MAQVKQKLISKIEKKRVHCLITRGGFEAGKDYVVDFHYLSEGKIQIYEGNNHIYCHGGLKEVNEHFGLVLA